MKKLLSIILLLLFLPTVLAVDLSVEKEASQDIIIAGLNEPVIFNLEITNKAERLQVSLNNRSGFNLQINPAFFLSLGKKSRVYALMHETLHVVYKHI